MQSENTTKTKEEYLMYFSMKRSNSVLALIKSSCLPLWLTRTSSNYCFPQLLPLIEPNAFNQLVASFFTLLTVIVFATIDPQIELQDKLLLQSSGLSHFLDTYSDAIAVAVIIYQMVKRNNWYFCSKALKMSYLGEILFGIVATHFHAVGVERSGKDPHPFYCCYFCFVGAFILYWHARGLTFHISCKSLQKHLDMKIKASFMCLALMPLLLCSIGLSHAINRFVFNGYAFVYGSIVMDPILKRGMRDTKSKFIKMKLHIARCFFPMIFLAFVTEAMLAEKFHFDTHCIVHVLALAYVLLVHSCINVRGK